MACWHPLLHFFANQNTCMVNLNQWSNRRRWPGVVFFLVKFWKNVSYFYRLFKLMLKNDPQKPVFWTMHDEYPRCYLKIPIFNVKLLRHIILRPNVMLGKDWSTSIMYFLTLAYLQTIFHFYGVSNFIILGLLTSIAPFFCKSKHLYGKS